MKGLTVHILTVSTSSNMSKLQGRLLDDIIAGTIILWRVLFIICHTIVTKILIAMFQPCTAGLHQMIVSIY